MFRRTDIIDVWSIRSKTFSRININKFRRREKTKEEGKIDFPLISSSYYATQFVQRVAIRCYVTLWSHLDWSSNSPVIDSLNFSASTFIAIVLFLPLYLTLIIRLPLSLYPFRFIVTVIETHFKGVTGIVVGFSNENCPSSTVVMHFWESIRSCFDLSHLLGLIL